MILETRSFHEVSITLVAGDPSVARDARGNDRAGIARRVAPVLRASPASLVARRANVSFGHGFRQVHDDVITLTVIQQVDSIYTGCNRRNGPDIGRVFLMLNYTEKPQNPYIQS